MINDRYVIEFTDGAAPVKVRVSDRQDVSVSEHWVRVYLEDRHVDYPCHRIASVTKLKAEFEGRG